jgi:hypothetical protein
MTLSDLCSHASINSNMPRVPSYPLTGKYNCAECSWQEFVAVAGKEKKVIIDNCVNGMWRLVTVGVDVRAESLPAVIRSATTALKASVMKYEKRGE